MVCFTKTSIISENFAYKYVFAHYYLEGRNHPRVSKVAVGPKGWLQRDFVFYEGWLQVDFSVNQRKLSAYYIQNYIYSGRYHKNSKLQRFVFIFQIYAEINNSTIPHFLPMNTLGTVCCPVSLSNTFCNCGPWGPETCQRQYQQVVKSINLYMTRARNAIVATQYSLYQWK